MILTGERILQEQGKRIFIDDFSESRLNPNSYNLRLSDKIMVYSEIVLDPKKAPRIEIIKIPESGLELEKGNLYLGSTIEKTKTVDLVPILSGRSSIGRFGLAVHITAGFGDIGFNGYWTLELLPAHNIIVYPGMEICQIYYSEVLRAKDETEIKRVYNGKYQNNNGLQASKINKEY